jgi:hypothetical protein
VMRALLEPVLCARSPRRRDAPTTTLCGECESAHASIW